MKAYPSMSGYFSSISRALIRLEVDLLERGIPTAKPMINASTAIPKAIPMIIFVLFPGFFVYASMKPILLSVPSEVIITQFCGTTAASSQNVVCSIRETASNIAPCQADVVKWNVCEIQGPCMYTQRRSAFYISILVIGPGKCFRQVYFMK